MSNDIYADVAEVLEGPCGRPLLNPEQIAEIAHEANRAYCQAIGDDSQLPWVAAPDWQKDSAIKGVLFHVANPDATPENSHDAWLQEKFEQGWEYGPVKNPEKKEHPCFMAYELLPIEQRAKDYIFRGVVHACLKV